MTYLEALGLDLSNLCGQGYDGAGNMAVQLKVQLHVSTLQL